MCEEATGGSFGLRGEGGCVSGVEKVFAPERHFCYAMAQTVVPVFLYHRARAAVARGDAGLAIGICCSHRSRPAAALEAGVAETVRVAAGLPLG